VKATEKVILAPEIRGKYWSDPLMKKWESFLVGKK
jgi:hypothetical protein